MLTVTEVDVDFAVPKESVRLVMMQPWIRLDEDAYEPFKWTRDAVDGQIKALLQTIDLAKGGQSAPPASFTIFPEYSVPGITGVEQLDCKINEDLPNNSVVVAGLEGLDREEYGRVRDLLKAEVHEQDAPDAVHAEEWVNACVTWVKEASGSVRRWLQLKVRPAWSERNVQQRTMRSGASNYVFRGHYEETQGYPCRFVTFICYDWVAAINGTTACDEVLTQLDERWKGNPSPLHWVFVIQHNPQPHHGTFIQSTARFLTAKDRPFVSRHESIVIHANTAAAEHPTRHGEGGHSSCVFTPAAPFDSRGCRPTISLRGPLLRGTSLLRQCKDVIFREKGECVHRFDVRVPQWAAYDANDRTPPVLLAEVHPLHGHRDPRLPSAQVPASVKWVNDELDDIPSFAVGALAGSPLADPALPVETRFIQALRQGDGALTLRRMDDACARPTSSVDEEQRHDPDLWGDVERGALEHLLHTLTALGLAFPADLKAGESRGTIAAGGNYIRVFAIRGRTHDMCRVHYDALSRGLSPDPVLVVQRDDANFDFTKRDIQKYYESPRDQGARFVSFQWLAAVCRDAADQNELVKVLNEIVPVERRII